MTSLNIQDDFAHAVTLHKSGALTEAESAYKKILDCNANHPPSHRNYGLLLVSAGREEEAWPHLKAARKSFGDDINLLRAFVRAALKVRRPDRAISALERIVRTEQNNMDARRTLSQLLLQQKEFHKAIPHLSHVAASGPVAVAKDFMDLGLAHWATENIVDAAKAYRLALEKDELSTDCRLSLVRCLERLNQVEEAVEHVDALLDRQPDHTEALFWRGCLLFRQGELGQALECLNGLNGNALPDSLKVRYWFELGRAADKTSNAEVAMGAFNQGNTLWAERYAPVMSAKQSFADTVDYETSALNSDQAGAVDIRAPLQDTHPHLGFLVGMPRSGTTLLDQLLSGHTQVTVLEEKPYIEQLYRQFRNLEDGSRQLSNTDVESLRAAYWELAKHDQDLSGANLVIDKFPLNLVYARMIKMVWPDAPIVLAMRHPCDVCLSNFMQDYSFNPAMAHFADLEETADVYVSVSNLWEAAQRCLKLDAHVIAYENFVADPESEARKLLAHLGLPWEDGVLETHLTAQTRESIMTPSYRQVTEPIHTQVVGRWRKYQPWLEPYSDRLKPFAERYGYSID